MRCSVSRPAAMPICRGRQQCTRNNAPPLWASSVAEGIDYMLRRWDRCGRLIPDQECGGMRLRSAESHCWHSHRMHLTVTYVQTNQDLSDTSCRRSYPVLGLAARFTPILPHGAVGSLDLVREGAAIAQR